MMKKYMIGFLAGALFMVAGQSFAGSTSFVGKKIESEIPVTVDGKVVDKAIVLQGKSFVPVRSVTVAMGGEVAAVSKGGIELKTGIDLSNVEDKAYKLKVLNAAKDPLVKELEQYKSALPNLEKDLARAETDLERAKTAYPDMLPSYQRDVDSAKASIQQNKDKQAELQGKIDALDQQIAEVEAQP